MITLGPLGNPGASSHLKILNHTAKSLLPCEVLFLQVRRIHRWTSWGGIIQPLTGTHLMKWDTTG